jgi:hypothetical protein
MLLDFNTILKDSAETEIYVKIYQILNIIESADSRGYVNNLDLIYYPIINAFINNIVLEQEKEVTVNNKKTTIKYRDPKYYNGIKSHITYRWIYAVLMLNLYTLVELLKHNSDKETDFYSDLDIMSKELYDRLEPSIRKSLSKNLYQLLKIFKVLSILNIRIKIKKQMNCYQ